MDLSLNLLVGIQEKKVGTNFWGFWADFELLLDIFKPFGLVCFEPIYGHLYIDSGETKFGLISGGYRLILS